MKKGIDVSKHQGVVNFDQVKASGAAEFVMIRAVSTNKYGIYIDPQFERNYAECKRLGIPVGVYYYTYAQTPAQVDAELAMVRKAIAGKQFEYPMVIDVEENLLKPLSADALTDLVIRAAKAIESWGCYAMVYTYTYYQQTELNMSRLAAFDLWIADYRGIRPSIKHGMWQHTSRGRVPGVSGYVDCNFAYNDYPALIKGAKLNGFAEEAQAPAQPTAPAPHFVISTSPCTGGDAASLFALLTEQAARLGNISVSKTEV